jgi:hypothetical protein
MPTVIGMPTTVGGMVVVSITDTVPLFGIVTLPNWRAP